jgi:hypothetical protein
VRQLLHAGVGILFWIVTLLLWWLLWAQHKATGTALLDGATRVAVCVGIVLGLTMWWISHNVAISRRKGPRTGRPDVPADTESDRLGRRLVWEVGGGAAGALDAHHLVVDVEGDVKTYRRAP